MEVHCEGCWEHTCICPLKKNSKLKDTIAFLDIRVQQLSEKNRKLQMENAELKFQINELNKELHNCLYPNDGWSGQ